MFLSADYADYADSFAKPPGMRGPPRTRVGALRQPPKAAGNASGAGVHESQVAQEAFVYACSARVAGGSRSAAPVEARRLGVIRVISAIGGSVRDRSPSGL